MLRLALCGLAVVVMSWAVPALGQVRYDYDALGRLVRVTDELGRAAVYVYGPTGNIVQIIREDVAPGAPTVSSVTPDFVRPGQAKRIVLAGTNLASASVTSPTPGLTVSVASATQHSLELTVLADSGLSTGVTQLAVTNTAGTAPANVTIIQRVSASVVPATVMLAPGTAGKVATVVLSEADDVPLSFQISVSNPSIATPMPATYSIPAGQTTLTVGVTGLQEGMSTLVISSESLSAPAEANLLVAGAGAPRSADVGVFRPTTASTVAAGLNVGVYRATSSSQTTITTGVGVYRASASSQSVTGPSVGVARGGVAQSAAPATLVLGSATPLTVTGFELSGTSLSIQPGTGLTVGLTQANAGGTEVSSTVTVSCSAPATLRQVALSGGVRFSPSSAAAVSVAAPGVPVVGSLAPTSAAQGASLSLSLGGTNLFCATSVELEPADGVSFTSAPVVNADGTELTIGLTLDASAGVGDRVVRVITPFGTSSSIATSGNTFTVSTP